MGTNPYIDAEAPPQLSDAWVKEINRRIADIESGNAKGIPWEEALAGARARLARAD